MSVDEMLILAPRVMALSASVGTADPTSWTIGYAPETDPDGDRFLLAYLHVSDESGTADVEIAASIVDGPVGDLDEDQAVAEFEVGLAAHQSIEALYMLARVTALGILGTIEARIEIPLLSPDPEVTRLVRPQSDD